MSGTADSSPSLQGLQGRASRPTTPGSESPPVSPSDTLISPSSDGASQPRQVLTSPATPRAPHSPARPPLSPRRLALRPPPHVPAPPHLRACTLGLYLPLFLFLKSEFMVALGDGRTGAHRGRAAGAGERRRGQPRVRSGRGAWALLAGAGRPAAIGFAAAPRVGGALPSREGRSLGRGRRGRGQGRLHEGPALPPSRAWHAPWPRALT